MESPLRAEGKVEFNRDIRPILSENCFACHGNDRPKRKAGLRLDDRAVAIAKSAIVPGNAEASELIARLESVDPDEVMPPPETNKSLTTDQKKLIKRWIEEGAEYQPHWAYVTPSRSSHLNSSYQPIDAFVMANLQAEGLTASPEADRATLIRRLSLDLTGIPPTPAEVSAFLDDATKNAYEKLVDRLLASLRYGERMAVPWLDVVRFADTVGYHGDQNMNIFPYRDYVINAFNTNKPFDQFTIEQIAGDLLPNPTTEQLVATGFNRLNMVTREGGAQPKEYLAKYASDRVRTVAATWLGSTMGCCECHDHKYDPFTAKDFYKFSAFFADVKQWGVYADYGYTPNPDLPGWSNDHPFPPEIDVKSPYLEARQKQLVAGLDTLILQGSVKLGEGKNEVDFNAWRKYASDYVTTNPSGWHSPQIDVENKDLSRLPDGSILVGSKPAKVDARTYTLPLSPGWVTAIRFEAIPDESHDDKITREGAPVGLLTLSAQVFGSEGQKGRKLSFSDAQADFKEDRYRNGAAILTIQSGWKLDSKKLKQAQTSVWRLSEPLKVLGEGQTLAIMIKGDHVGRIRLSLSPFVSEIPQRIDLDDGDLAVLQEKVSQPDRLKILYLMGTAWDQAISTKVAGIQKEILACRDGNAKSLVTEAWEPKITRVLPRGNWQDDGGEVVSPGVPGFLPQPPMDRPLNRLDLARWLVSSENPLTSRVIVNRLWKQFFGTGLSGVVEDLGAQGESPSHPELLDWLAVDFREHGWDVKRIVKQIVMSATYRQSSKLRPRQWEVDPGNRLLASQSSRRLDAEFVRDNALAIAGLLNFDLGGPSVHPYQPAGYYAALQFPDRDYVAERDDRQYRRGVYAHLQRTFLQPMLANFDASSREECVASRNVANTPQQALTLLNDPTFVEAARVLAVRVVSEAQSDEQRLDLIYHRVLARAPKPNERHSLSTFLSGQLGYYRDHPEEAFALVHVGASSAADEANQPQLAAWTSVARVLLNLHETITRY